ncbi:hypothetical protein Pr1d_33100 [Bythopirellula goksoeyrii]|uniref:Uncharacterized protein n=1 Tax=Bythopirellula goksoeyrii TaxID=1400387 RepID=A0A5B9QPF1_9BACT|nr:hypothetical protein Pr1d_33100 [Bythopirellula goksoeyrii]
MGKPLPLQPVDAVWRTDGGTVAEAIFRRGLWLPGGANQTQSELDRSVSAFRSALVRDATSRRSRLLADLSKKFKDVVNGSNIDLVIASG